MFSEDAVFVGNYVFWNFGQKVSHIVYFQYRPLIEDEEADVQSEIISLFEKIGLWEDYINIQKTVKEEIAGGASQASSNYNRPNQFNIEFGKSGPFGTPICVVRYTQEESRRLTKGRSSQVELDIDEVKNHLIGLHKWIVLMRVRSQF